MSNTNKIKVLIVDDSALVRKVLREWINEQDDMEVIAVAADPYVAVEKMKTQRPDVITLDIEMPRMNGLTFLRKLMGQQPIPVIIVSSLTKSGSDSAIKAMEYGAVDVFHKDDIQVTEPAAEKKELLLDGIRAAGIARVKRVAKSEHSEKRLIQELATAAMTEKVIVLGASTGGTTAIHDIVTILPASTPGMVIVQHMPKDFTKLFADRLNELSLLQIKEAEDGDVVSPGHVFIAPGDKHVRLARKGAKVVIQLWNGPLVNRHKPAVDVLFESAAEIVGNNCIGVLLTGMGKDGAQGMLTLKQHGAFTIAQDEASSVVYGMPKEAVKLQAVTKVLPLHEIPYALINQQGKTAHIKNGYKNDTVIQELTALQISMREQLRHFSFHNDHIMRGPLCRIMGLIDILKREQVTKETQRILEMLIHEVEQVINVTYIISRNINEHEEKLIDKN